MSTPLLVVGVGNSLRGDDGVGLAVVEELGRLPWPPGVAFHRLEGDLYALADLATHASFLLVVDATVGPQAGTLVPLPASPRAQAPSFHQGDVVTVLCQLEFLLGPSFPPWEAWGVTISPPLELGEGLSPPLRAALPTLVAQLAERIRALVAQGPPRPLGGPGAMPSRAGDPTPGGPSRPPPL